MIYLFLAEGFEEIEAIAVIDILRRAELEVTTVGVGSSTIIGSHGITVHSDISTDEMEFDDLEMVILPGGLPGTFNLEENEVVQNAIKFANDNDKYLCAICAAPSIFGHLGILKDKNAVCYPAFKEHLIGATYTDDRVCVDGKIITSIGAGSAMEFGLKIVEILKNKDLADNLSSAMMCK